MPDKCLIVLVVSLILSVLVIMGNRTTAFYQSLLTGDALRRRSVGNTIGAVGYLHGRSSQETHSMRPKNRVFAPGKQNVQLLFEF